MATARSTTEMHGDGPPLADAFAGAGIAMETVPWGSDRAWSAFDGVVIRTTWDYIDDRDGFLAWAGDVSRVTNLANPLAVLAWNTDKRYLRDLAAAGIPTVPTHWIEPGSEPTLPEDWTDFVVKPAISAGARRSGRYRADDRRAALAHIAALLADGTAAMVQPYVATVDERGETGTYFFGGTPSHAIIKGPVLRHGYEPPDDLHLGATQSVSRTDLDDDVLAFSRRVLDAVPGGADQVLYARVDTAFTDDGKPMLLELELTEPFLWLETDPSGAERYVSAIAVWLS